MVFQKRSLHGFTLAELMIVIVLIAILAVFGLLAFQKQTIRGYDSKRKTDLAELKVVLEDYYNDKGAYPSMGDWKAYHETMCTGSQFLASYLQGHPVPCDPITNEPYLYITTNKDGAIDATSTRTGYKLFAALGNLTDIDIPGSGCSPDPNQGCGYGPSDCEYCLSKYNYGISVGGTIANPVFDFFAPTPTPTISSGQGDNFCLGDPNPEHACNTKAGLIAPDGRSCSTVLRELCPDSSFADGALCNARCKSNYTKYKCPATSTLQCVQP